MRGWNVTAVDFQQILLDKACRLASRNSCNICTKCIDLEKEIDSLENKLYKVHLLHISRFLCRPLFPVIRNLILPGGFLIYNTFTKGTELFGKPKNPKFILKLGELKDVFSDWNILIHEEKRLIEDGRPVEFIVAQKPIIES